MIIAKFVKDCLTEDDAGTTFCYIRMLTILAGFVLLGIMIAQAYHDIEHFKLEEAGRTVLEYLGGSAIAIWGKTKSGA